ncbi:hypothetical protein SAMN04487918_1011883 [Bacillus sp. bc15]|uniref:HEPN domain-containing protein n=1 Tax=Bacillus TaxID=1386 RepID=UPI00091AF1A3|nr:MULTISPECIES: HEPN domain-containing protein [Bacillus]PGW74492.1 hypothetical protein COE21_21400 [Bacillus thuringiensis]SHL25460.1 hypothetical protein SAMN04487918_1011883 [Bacillus sp. bc15]
MTELFRIAAKRTPLKFPFEPFKNSIVHYELIMYQDEKMVEALLLKGDNGGVPIFLLVGASSLKGNLFGINKNIALQLLNLMQNRLTKYESQKSNEEISIDKINSTISSLEQLTDKQIGDGEKLIRFANNMYILLDLNADKKTLIKLQIQVSEGNFIKPSRFNFIGYSGSDDYGEIVLTDIFEKDLKSFHLIHEFSIYIDYGEGIQQEYVGLVLSVRKENNTTVKLFFSTNVYNLKNSNVGVLISESTDPRYLIDFMIRSYGWETNIEGIANHIQPYIVMIPVHNILVETDAIGIGNVELLARASKNDDVLLMKDKLKEKWKEFTIAKVNVDSRSYYEAYCQASKQIEDALNAINHIVKQDSLYELYSTQNQVAEWNRDVFIPKPQIGSIVYARNLVTNGIVISDMERIVEPNVLKLDESFNDRIEGLEWYEDLIADNMDNNISNEKKNLLNALKWLKRSWDATDLEDQIIFSNIAIEFLLSGEKVPPLLNKDIRNKIVDVALNEFDSIFDGDVEDKDRLYKDIKQKFSAALTNAPLFAKLYNLIDKLDIPITDRDSELLKRIRKKRNDLVHGRATESTDRMDIWNSNTIIGMIIAYKMKYRGELNEYS